MFVKFVIVLFLFSGTLARPKEEACTEENCQPPSCRCFGDSLKIPIDRTPQLVLLSNIGDALQYRTYNTYKRTLFNRKNPDDCSIGFTFFVPHDQSNHSMMHDLWQRGFEIADHSITNNASAERWKTADVDLLVDEFSQQKDIIERFADIEISEIKGGRLPQFQQSGDNYTEAFIESDLVYDSSWLTQYQYWPYTLDYLSDQDCPSNACPVKPAEGLWVLPVNQWRDADGTLCATVDGCSSIPQTEDKVYDWMVDNFMAFYNSTKVPFHMIMNEAAFKRPNMLTAFERFLDFLEDESDVYIVNHWQAVQYMMNPKSLDEPNPLGECPPKHDDEPCVHKACTVMHQVGDEKEERRMSICNRPCPKKYPWLGNTSGTRKL